MIYKAVTQDAFDSFLDVNQNALFFKIDVTGDPPIAEFFDCHPDEDNSLCVAFMNMNSIVNPRRTDEYYLLEGH